jgi:hypothetical protein
MKQEQKMSYEYEIDDIDYEDMDDLALPDHIDWSEEHVDEFSMDALDLIYA